MKLIFQRCFRTALLLSALLTLSNCGQITTSVLKTIADQGLVDLFQLLLVGTNNSAPGSCVPVSVNLLKNGSATTPTSSITVTFTPAQGLQLFSSRVNNQCQSPVSQVTLSQLVPSQQIFARATAEGTYTISAAATPSTIGGSTISLTFTTPANLIPTQLRITGPSQTQINTTTMYNVELLNNASQSVTALVDTTVTVQTSSSTQGTDHLYAQQNSTQETNIITIQAGNNSASVFYNGEAPPRTVTLNATAAGLIGANFSINLTAGSASRLALLGPDPMSIVAGTCNTFVIQIQDPNGVGIVEHPTVTGTVGGTIPLNSAYSINSCAPGTNLVNNQFTIPNGTSVATVYLRIDVPNSAGYSFNAQAQGYASDSKNIIVLTSTALTLAGQIQPGGTTQGFTDTCFDYRLGLVNQTGSVVSAPNTFTAQIIDDPSGGRFSLTCGGAAISTVTFTVGETFKTVKYQRQSVGEVVLAVSPNVNNIGGSMTQPLRIVSGRPISLLLRKVFTQNPRVGECSGAIYANQTDAQANITPVVSSYFANIVFSEFESAFAPVAFIDPACQIPLDYVAGSTTTQRLLMAVDSIFTSPQPKVLYFKYGKPNDDFRLTISSVNPQLNPDSEILRVDPGVIDQLRIVSAPTSTLINTCSQPIVVQIQDSTGTPTTSLASILFSIAVNPAAGIQVFLDNLCSIAAASTASIPPGTSQISLYVRGSQLSNFSFSVQGSFSGSSNSHSVSMGISSGQAVGVAWKISSAAAPSNLLDPVFLKVNQCSGQMAQPISGVLASVDGNGNLAPASQQINFNSIIAVTNPGGSLVTFVRAFLDAACTVPATTATIAANATTSAVMYFKGTNPGSYFARATRAGMTDTNTRVEILPDNPNHLVVAGPTVLQSGQCSSQLNNGGTTAFSFDQFNFLAPGAAYFVNLIASNNAFKFYRDPNCTIEINQLDFAAGSAVATPSPIFAKSNVVGDFLITFQPQSGSGVANLTITIHVQSGNPESLSLFVADASQTTFQVGHYTARLRDQTLSTIIFPNASTATLRERNGASGINLYPGHITSNSTTSCPAGGSSGPININFLAGQPAEIRYSVCGSVATTTKRAIVNIMIPYFSTNIAWDQYVNVVSNSCTPGATMTLTEALPSCTVFGCAVIFYYQCSNNGTWFLVSIFDPRYSGCFAPETQIAMANGHVRRADSVNVGDKVWNPVTEEVVEVIKVVAGLEKKPLIEFQIEEGKKLRVSDKHPMWTQTGFKQAGEVTLKDKLLGQDGTFRRILKRTELPVKKGQLVYNFVVGTPSGDHLDSMVLADGVVTGDLKAQIWLEDKKIRPMAQVTPLTLKRKNYCELDPQDPIRHLYSKLFAK